MSDPTMPDDFARAYAEAFPDQLRDYVAAHTVAADGLTYRDESGLHPHQASDAERAGEPGDFSKMKAIAEAATPGPWAAITQSGGGRVEGAGPLGISIAWCGSSTAAGIHGSYSISGGEAAVNAAFIVAAQPAAVLSLIKRVEEAEAVLAGTLSSMVSMSEENADLRKRLETAEAAQKRAPVQGFSAGIPWGMHLRAYDAYSKKWAPQKALITGGCRGGFSVNELDQFIPGWRDELSEISRLRALLAEAGEALKAAEIEISEAADKFHVFGLNHPGGFGLRGMAATHLNEDKAAMKELATRFSFAGGAARTVATKIEETLK